MDSFSVDVAIIGGGPVGLFASHLLSSRGVTVAVLEKELDEFPYPRAVQFNSDILRSFRSASTKLSRLMLEHVQLVPEMVCTRSPMKSNTVMCNTGGAKLNEYIKIFEEELMTQFTPIHTFHQPTFEGHMRDLLEQEYEPDEVQVLFGCTVTDITTESDGTYTLTFEHDGELGTCQANYVLGCDGANSFTRKHVKAKFGGSSWTDQPWLVIDCILQDPTSKVTTALAASTTVIDPRRPFFCIPLPENRWRFELSLRTGESPSEMTKTEVVHRLMREQGLQPDEFKIEQTVVYSYHARIASHWRKGNIFLLGDAAHCQPAITGGGLCNGMRDALNLCWKLAYVIKGKASASLLETYEEERHTALKEDIASAIAMSKHVMEKGTFKVLWRNLGLFLSRMTMGDLWSVRNRHGKAVNSGLPYVSGGFTIPSLDAKALTAGKMMISPKLRIIYSEPWANSNQQKSTMQISRRGMRQDATLGTAFLDDFVSWRNLTIIWITRSALEPTAQVAFSQSDQAFLTELGITMLHVRLTDDVSNSKAKGADATLKDEAGKFTQWANTAFNEKKEVLVLRPDLLIFGVYTHKEVHNIVPDLEDMMWLEAEGGSYASSGGK